MGDSLQVFKQRLPKSQLQQTNGEQTLEHSWQHKGHTVTVKTTRFDFNGHGAWETKASWQDRHQKAVAEMQAAFPPDPKMLGGHGDAVGSLPGPEHTCPGGLSFNSEWKSEIVAEPGTYYRVVHHVHQAKGESPAEFGERCREGQAEADSRWPAP